MWDLFILRSFKGVRDILDQNADRMYWVIGAVLVVGALIGLSVKEYPDILNNVFSGFTAKIPKF